MARTTTARRRSRARALCATASRALSLALALLAASATAALADADPASDQLLVQNVFFPYQPTVSQPLQNALNTATAEAAKAGFPVRVAIIASPIDLGGLPDMFGQAQRYANFLAAEIAFNGHHPLLAVMPQGFGLHDAGSPATLSTIQIVASQQSDGLARAALAAVQKLAAAAGHPINRVSVGGSSSGSSVSPLLAFGVPVLLVLLFAVIAGIIRRRRGDEDEGDDIEAAYEWQRRQR